MKTTTRSQRLGAATHTTQEEQPQRPQPWVCVAILSWFLLLTSLIGLELAIISLVLRVSEKKKHHDVAMDVHDRRRDDTLADDSRC